MLTWFPQIRLQPSVPGASDSEPVSKMELYTLNTDVWYKKQHWGNKLLLNTVAKNVLTIFSLFFVCMHVSLRVKHLHMYIFQNYVPFFPPSLEKYVKNIHLLWRSPKMPYWRNVELLPIWLKQSPLRNWRTHCYLTREKDKCLVVQGKSI